MKTIVGISNYSFEQSHFSSLSELEKQFADIKNMSVHFAKKEVDIAVANDILLDKYFGLSINEQLANFQYICDKGLIAGFLMKLERNYLRGMNRKLSSLDLKNKSREKPNIITRENTILYVPNLVGDFPYSFNSIDMFYNHYEYVLGAFPIDSKSYYDKAICYFDNLLFHDECESTLDLVDGKFCDFTISFTKCLKALNNYDTSGKTSTTARISEIDKLTKYKCTGQGSSHSNFKFTFQYEGNTVKGLDCQYHLKPSDNNTKGDNSFYHNRIYFGFIPMSCGKKWKIAIASIGPHINDGAGDRFKKNGK